MPGNGSGGSTWVPVPASPVSRPVTVRGAITYPVYTIVNSPTVCIYVCSQVLFKVVWHYCAVQLWPSIGLSWRVLKADFTPLGPRIYLLIYRTDKLCCVPVQNGGIFVDFHDGSGDDRIYEDVYNSFESSGGQSCTFSLWD